eukprot:752279-Hanusia_phi.AAC.2
MDNISPHLLQRMKLKTERSKEIKPQAETRRVTATVTLDRTVIPSRVASFPDSVITDSSPVKNLGTHHGMPALLTSNMMRTSVPTGRDRMIRYREKSSD